MQTGCVLIATVSAVLAVTKNKPPAFTNEKLFKAAYCGAADCSMPGLQMPKELLRGGLVGCKKLKDFCYDKFSQCANSIAETLKKRPTEGDELSDFDYDLENTSDPFLVEVRSAIIRYASSTPSREPGRNLLDLPSISPWKLTFGIYCH